MANTYTQLLVQLVFAVKGRHSLIYEPYRDRVEKFMCGIIKHRRCRPLAIYCNPDHCHVLIGLNASVSVAEIARLVKAGSSKWINEQPGMPNRFAWQEGYGAFTYARSQLESVVKYIMNQPEHHRTKTFREEYLNFLKKFDVDYDSRYLFEFID